MQNEEHRQLKMDGAFNTRELGGYQTQDGKTVQWGKLYRSDKLSDLSFGDQEYLQELGIQKIVDFRSAQEKDEDPDVVPAGIRYVEMPIDADAAMRSQVEDILRGKSDVDVRTFLLDANVDFATKYKDIFSQFLKDLAREQTPTLFHCTSGKDRAGFAAAITLLAIGVSKEDVINDYMKTNLYTADRIDSQIKQIKIMSLNQVDGGLLRPLLGVELAYILTAFETAEKEYGSMDNFIRTGLNISEEEITKLKQYLLEG